MRTTFRYSARYTAAVVAALLVGGSVAVAQTPPTAPPGSPRGAREAPRGADRADGAMQQRLGRGPAANLLRLKGQLELTDEQVKRLEGLGAQAAPQPNRAEMMRAQADLLEAQQGNINVDKARTALDRMARVRTEQQLAGLKMQQEARNVLTASQRTRFDNLSANARARQGNRADRGRGGVARSAKTMRGAQGSRGFRGAPPAARMRSLQRRPDTMVRPPVPDVLQDR